MDIEIINDEGKVQQPSTLIVPVLKRDEKSNETVIKGTAFFVGINGVLLTAKHVILDVNDQPYQNLSIIHITDRNVYFRRNVGKALVFNGTDIAFLFLETMTSKIDGAILSNAMFSLTERTPSINEKIITYGYPMTANIITRESENAISIDLNPDYYSGEIIDYQDGPTAYLKNPSIITNMNLINGISGGPVFDSLGAVFAVNSTALEMNKDMAPISFVSPLAPIFDLVLNLDSNESVTLRELAIQNRVSIV